MKNNIKVERARNNLTQARLANLAGVSRQTINSMELGKYVPSTVLALKLSDIFGLPVNEIFELEKEDWK
ncbi:MAG: helix-turn-helix transcriptional regulator [Cyclobacteriaceae bacterium]